jgi:hypothetical protein
MDGERKKSCTMRRRQFGLAMNGAIARAIDIFRAEAFDPLQPSL